MFDEPFRLSTIIWNWGIAALLLLIWAVFSVWIMRKKPRPEATGARNLVIYASQTGHAADIAERTQAKIKAAGEDCDILEADRATPQLLASAGTILFIASTTGEGHAPDNATHFAKAILREQIDLSACRVAILALGDKRYPDFCAFGRKIDLWARECLAEIPFPMVEVDDLAHADLDIWNRRLAEIGFPELSEQVSSSDEKGLHWRVGDCAQVAGPSHGQNSELTSDGLYRITLHPAQGTMPSWEIGDLFELTTPDGHVRDYSIANRPNPDEILLFIRRVVDMGAVGRGSGLLTGAKTGSTIITGRIRTHRSFHPSTGAGPLLAIGAGSGWAGVRPHLLHAMAQGRKARLVFGERQSESNSPLLREVEEWHTQGVLDDLRMVLSNGNGKGPYVQHHLAGQAKTVRDYLREDGAIVVCGRLAMGEAALATIAEIMGENWLARAREEGRVRRDLY